MSDEIKKSSPHIRTFASDMKVEQKRRGLSDETKTDVGAKKPLPKVETSTEPKKLVKQKAATGHETVPHASAGIPAFHVLDKKAKKRPIPNKETPAPSSHTMPVKKTVTADKPKVIRTNIESDATVITDTKQNRFKLIPSIITSVDAWFKSITTFKKKKVPTYTIPEASRRKGVIQKATSQSGTVFTADSGTLKEQIRLRRIEEANKRKFDVDSEVDEPETTWSPYTDVGYNLLDAPESEQKKALDRTENVTVAYRENIATVPIPAPEPVVFAMPPIPETVEKEAPSLEIPSPPKQVVIESIAEQEKIKLPVEEVIEEPVEEEYKQQPESFTEKVNTNTLAIIILGSIVAVVLILFTGRIFIQYISNSMESETSNINAPEAIMSSTTLNTLTLTQANVNNLAIQIADRTPDTNDQIAEFVIVSQNGAVISPSNIFSTLGFSVVSSLHRSLTDMRFLSTNSTNDILLLKFIDEDTVRGGMLIWEQNLANDMNSIFDLPPSLTDNNYSDITVAGVDVRVLENNEEIVLLYGIIDENTALITTDESYFVTIIETSFSN